MYGGSAHSGHSGYHGGDYQPYNPALRADDDAQKGAHAGRLDWARDALPDARVPAAALTAEQAEQFKAQLGQLSVREFHEIYQTMHSEVPTAIAHYAPLGTLGGALGGPADTSMPNAANFLRPIPDAIKNDQDPRGMSIVQLIESGTLTPGELMVLCDVMHNDQVQKMMESLNPSELAARGNFTINDYCCEAKQRQLFGNNNPFAECPDDNGDEDGDNPRSKDAKRLADFAAACEDMNRTEAEKLWDSQMHRIGDMEFSGAELHAMWKYMNDPANDEEIIDAIMADDPGISREEAKKRRASLKRTLDLMEKERNGTITQAEREELDRLKKDKNIQKDLDIIEKRKSAHQYDDLSPSRTYIVGTVKEKQKTRDEAHCTKMGKDERGIEVKSLFIENNGDSTRTEKPSGGQKNASPQVVGTRQKGLEVSLD